MAARVEKVVLNKQQTAFVTSDSGNGVSVVSGSVSEIGSILSSVNCAGCKIIFSVEYSKNETRTFNAYVKRAMQIAACAGVRLSDAQEFYIDGFRQSSKYVMEVQ